jgi:hypothetical protein
VFITIALLVSASLLASSIPVNEDDWWPAPESTRAGLLPREETVYGEFSGEAEDPTDVRIKENVTSVPGGLACTVGRTGTFITIPYNLHEGRRWDYAWVKVDAQEGAVTLGVYDSSLLLGQSVQPLASTTVQAPADRIQLDRRDIDHVNYTEIVLRIHLDHTGHSGVPPMVDNWIVGDCDLDLWHDPFMDVGRDDSRGDLLLKDGQVAPQRMWLPGGIYGTYYNNRDFTGATFTRLDETIDYNWGNGGPGGGFGSNTFSVRWIGRVLIPINTTYTFYLTIDDGGRMWLDDELIINQWRDQAPREFRASRVLSPGFHTIRIDYYENGGGAVCHFRWSSPYLGKDIVPHTSLYGVAADNSLTSERIDLPTGHRWDLLMLDLRPGFGEVVVDVVDGRTGEPVPGLEGLVDEYIDLTTVVSGNYPSIRLVAKWTIYNLTAPVALEHWGVTWIPERTWRCEFLSDLRIVGTVGLRLLDGYIMKDMTDVDAEQVAFAERTDGSSDTIFSSIFTDWMEDAGVLTTEASDVELADLDKDGILDVLFTSSAPGVNATAYRGHPGGFKDLPMLVLTHQASNPTSSFSNAHVADFDGNGGPDVLLVEHPSSGPDQLLLYFWNGTGINETPDKVVIRFDGTVAGIDTGDIDGDGRIDIAVAINSGDDNGTYILWGEEDGHGIDSYVKTLSRPCYAVHVGQVDGDDYDDIVIGCPFLDPGAGHGIGPTNYENHLYYGSAQRNNIPFQKSFQGEAAVAATLLDWDGDGANEIALVRDGNVTIFFPPFGPSDWRFTTLETFGAVDIAPYNYGLDAREDLAIAVQERDDHDQLKDYNLTTSWYASLIPPSGLYFRQVPTDGAVAVDSGMMFGRATGALRTRIVDLGDPSDAGGWDRLSYRVSGGEVLTGQELTFRLVDAETEEVVWEKTTTEPQGSLDVSAIRAKEHPTLYIDAFLKNLNARGFSLGYLAINWTERRPAPPDILYIQADDREIFRTQSTVLRIGVNDEYDLPEQLLMVVQVRPPLATGWSRDLLDNPTWDGTDWIVTFSPGRNAATGNYTFRAQARDSDMMDSPWLEGLDLVRVLNNPPLAPVIALVPEGPRTTDDIECDIVRQAPDPDTAHLDYIFEWYLDGVHQPDITGALVSSNLTRKDQVWRVVVRADDGEDLGPAVEANLTVINSGPEVVADLPNIQLNEDDPTEVLDLSAYFMDPDMDALLFSVEGFSDIDAVVDPSTGRLTLTLQPNWWGAETAKVTVSDEEYSVNATLDVNVRPVFDPPLIVSVGGQEPTGKAVDFLGSQGGRMELHVAVEDPDSKRFVFSINLTPPWFELTPENGTMVFTPTNAEVGTWTFNLTVRDDKDETDTVFITIVVENVNDPPGNVFILQPTNGREYVFGSPILLQGSSSDPDQIHGQKLSFRWLSNVSGEIATGAITEVAELPSGKHVITLEVSDGALTNSVAVKITILPKGVVPPNGNGNGNNGPPITPEEETGGLMAVIVLALLVIVIVIGVIIVRRRFADQEAMKEMKWPAIDEKEPWSEDAGKGQDMLSMMLMPTDTDEIPKPVSEEPKPKAPLAKGAEGWELSEDEAPPTRPGVPLGWELEEVEHPKTTKTIRDEEWEEY